MTDRDLIVQRMNELNRVNFIQPTARDLHSNGLGLGRLQRRENKRYEESIKKQKARLANKLVEIDSYLQSVEDYNNFIPPKPKDKDPIQVIYPTLLPQPTMVIGTKPVLKKTRLPRYQQRRRSR